MGGGPMTDVVIRPFQEKDSNRILELWQACGLVVPWNDPRKDIARKVEADPEGFLVLEWEGAVAASVMAGYDGHRGWINYLAVDPVYEGKGLGRRLMAAAEQLLRQRGCPKINLQIRRSNQQAIGFYRAVGFQEDEVLSMGKRLEKDD